MHDDDGRLAASSQEPEWDEQERGWMLALADLEAAECPGCGGDLEETAAPENNRDNPQRTGEYEVGAPHRCHRCTELARAQDAASNPPQGRAPHPFPSALLWSAQLKRVR